MYYHLFRLGFYFRKGEAALNRTKIEALSAEICIKYYDNDYMSFLEQFDDDALWYGPCKGQILVGREAMIRTWNNEKHTLSFTIGNVKTTMISSHPSFCDVMVSFPVITHYPNGEDMSVDQRVLLTWGERTITDENGNRQKVPRILLCHISNPHEKDAEDTIYPIHYSQIYAGTNIVPQKGKRIHFTGADRSEYFLLSDAILWIEATNDKHSIIHTPIEEIKVLSTLSDLATSYPDIFLRCHQSYLVNPNYITNIRRFMITLSNGVELPVPEKKYTMIKGRIMDLLTS